MATESVTVDNPYGIGALWAQGDFVAKGVLILLVLMSAYSWFIIFTKWWEQRRLLSQAHEAEKNFWAADNIKTGLNKLSGKGSRTSLPEYPPASRRAGEAGTVQLRCFVKEDGRCTEVAVVKSSGFDKLDEAAVKEVQRNWKFVPGKEDGKPVATWHTFAVTFQLTD